MMAAALQYLLNVFIACPVPSLPIWKMYLPIAPQYGEVFGHGFFRVASYRDRGIACVDGMNPDLGYGRIDEDHAEFLQFSAPGFACQMARMMMCRRRLYLDPS
jgi:hypothetical protein